MLLQDFPCTVVHVSGKNNVVADILSRYPSQSPQTNELDHFSHIVMIENENIKYEPLLEYVYQYIMNHDYHGIPENYQRRVHLEPAKYLIHHQKLYKRSSYGMLLVPTLSNRNMVMNEVHDGHGHFGQEATYQRARRHYYWPKMYDDLKKLIKTCHECQVCDKKMKKARSKWPITTIFLFQRLGLDYIGPLTESISGNKYILVLMEYYTKWPMAFPVAEADAVTTAEILYREVFCNFGPPSEILTDRGTHFANKLIADLCRVVNVRHKFSTPYHPQTNGLVENMNGTLINILRKLSLNYPTRWDEWIPTALYAYRTKVHTTLKYTPYELLYGILPRSTDPIQTVGQRLGEERLAALDATRDQAHLRLIETQAAQWNPEVTYQQGDYVLVKRAKRLKIQPPWHETPFKVYRAHENNTYDLIDDEGNFYKTCLHADRLKLYHRPT